MAPDATEQSATDRPHLLGASGKSKLQLAKPLSQKARRIVRNKTNRLIKKRKQVDQALQEESLRDDDSLRPKDYLARQQIVKLDDALARREARHLRARSKAILERERLYKWDPSTERSIDLDLFKKYHFKFKRHLGSSLLDRELPSKPRQLPLQTRESADDTSCDEHARPDIASDSDSDSASDLSIDDSDSVSDSDSDRDDKTDNGCDGGNKLSYTISSSNIDQICTSLDGAFDDSVQMEEALRKRKYLDSPNALANERDDRRKAKKAKKARAAIDKHEPALESQFFQSSIPQNEEDAPSGYQAAIDSMSQSKKHPKVMINGESGICDSFRSNDKMTTNTASDKLSLAEVRDNPDTGTKIHNSSSTTTTDRPPSRCGEAPVKLQWYQIHARRQLQRDFDDCVRPKPRTRVEQRRSVPRMSGALPAPRSRVSGDLPSPQTSPMPSGLSSAAGSSANIVHTSLR